MTSFLDYHRRKMNIEEEIGYKAKKYDMEETLLVITDIMKFEDDFFSYVKIKDYASHLKKIEECISDIDTLVENYEKLQKLDISDNNELVDKIKNGITSMTNEIKSIKDEMIKKRLISIKAEVEVIVTSIV